MVAAAGVGVGVPAGMSLPGTPVRAPVGSSPGGASDSDAMAVSPFSDGMDVDEPSPVGAAPPPSGEGGGGAGVASAAAPYEVPAGSGYPPLDGAGPSRGFVTRGLSDSGGLPATSVAATPHAAPAAAAAGTGGMGVAATPLARRRAPGHAAPHGLPPPRRRQRRPPPPETISPLSVVMVLLLLLIPPLVGALSVAAPRMVRSFFFSRPSVLLMLVALVSGALFHTLLRSLGSGGGGERRRRRRHGDRDGGSPAEAYARLSRRLSVSGREFTEADYELLLELDERDERLERFLHGAGEAVIEALPVYVVKEGGGGRVCAVCMADLAVGDTVRILPCMDQYHVGCIDVWLRQKAVCPVCKWHIG